MSYFAAVPRRELTDDELARRSQALYQIGDVRIRQGRLSQALAPLQESLALAQALADRGPTGERLFGLGQSEFWVGYVHWEQGDLAAARPHFEAYRDLSERLTRMDPRSSKIRAGARLRAQQSRIAATAGGRVGGGAGELRKDAGDQAAARRARPGGSRRAVRAGGDPRPDRPHAGRAGTARPGVPPLHGQSRSATDPGAGRPWKLPVPRAPRHGLTIPWPSGTRRGASPRRPSGRPCGRGRSSRDWSPAIRPISSGAGSWS